MVWDLHAPTWRYSQLYMAEITTVAGCCNSNLLACKPRTACLQGREGLPSMQARSTFKAERTCLQCKEGLPSRQTRPAFKAVRACLQCKAGLFQGSEGLPSTQGWPTLKAERTCLQGREGLPSWQRGPGLWYGQHQLSEPPSLLRRASAELAELPGQTGAPVLPCAASACCPQPQLPVPGPVGNVVCFLALYTKTRCV